MANYGPAAVAVQSPSRHDTLSSRSADQLDPGMKFRTEVTIDADIDTVWRAFDNPDNLSCWQPTLKSFTPKSGVPGQPGAVSEVIYEEKGRTIAMTETITERREPHFLAGFYNSSHGVALIVNHFESVGDGRTRWVGYTNHSFQGIMKIMAIFVQRSIRERIENDMQRFKLFVESEVCGRAG